MIAAAGVEAVLGTGRAMVVDLVTLTIRRGRCHQFDGNGVFIGVKEIEDSVRWTSAPRALRTSATAKDGGQVYQPLQGVAYQRGSLQGSLGAEVLQISMSVAGTLPIYLATAQDGSGSFATSLMELALLGMLDGSRLAIDQAVVQELPATPVAAGAGYGVLTPDPVRVFDGVIRGAKPSSQSVEFDACDVLIQGGGSVPRNLFSPLCRWEFASGASQGVGCPMVKTLWGDGIVSGKANTHKKIQGSAVSFPYPGWIQFQSADAFPWTFIVPQDGPMMGMRFQLGNRIDGYTCELADTLPWSWSCTTAHIELACSKTLTQGDLETSAMACATWDVRNDTWGGAPGDIKSGFGGFPDMPEPESA